MRNKWINLFSSLFFWTVLCAPMVGTAAEGEMNLEEQKAAFIGCINTEGESLRGCAEVLVDPKLKEIVVALTTEHVPLEKKRRDFQLPPNWWRGGGIWTPPSIAFPLVND